MNTTFSKMVCRYSLLFISILAVACKKDSDPNDESNEQLYTLTFDFQDFDASTRPLNSPLKASSHANGTLRAGGITPQAQMGYLYFWSFNNQELTPDIASHTGAVITYQSSGQSTYPNGWAFENYSAGSALSMTGLSELMITMPVTRATALDEFGFDISSSGTGPKSFSLEYSFDHTHWVMKSAENQFSNTNPTTHPRNSFIFDFSDLLVEDENYFHIRVIPLEGERGSSGDYRPLTGVTRFDNIRLTGIATPPISSSVDELHYYVFDAVSSALVDSDVQPFDPSNPSFELSLPYGSYQIALVRNHSATSLLLPTQLSNNEQFYYANPFSNHLASIFASEITVNLDNDKQQSVTLDRYYSQIKFEFTDTRDLSHISRIVVSQLHQPFFYAPYLTNMPNPILDQHDIILQPDLGQSQEILFNQFVGKASAPQAVSYRLDVYGSNDELVRTFDVMASIRNNVQVVFRGELLFGVNQQAGFQVSFNENWDDEVVIGF